MECRGRKVKNATKVQENGIKFDSKLEMYLHKQLTINKIPFEFQKTYEIQPGFTYNGKKVQNMRIIVDFDLVANHNKIADTKGWQLETSRMKIKMLKYHFHKKNDNTEIVLLKDKKACDSFVLKLKNSNSNIA